MHVCEIYENEQPFVIDADDTIVLELKPGFELVVPEQIMDTFTMSLHRHEGKGIWKEKYHFKDSRNEWNHLGTGDYRCRIWGEGTVKKEINFSIHSNSPKQIELDLSDL